MVVDVILVVSLVWAVIRGLRQGAVIAIFSLVGFIVGIAAAMSLSAYVAQKISATGEINGKWLPAISFFLVFFAVVFAVAITARFISRTMDLALLGWANRIAGACLYILLISTIWSVLLFYLSGLGVLADSTLEKSKLYPVIKPIGPAIMEKLGELVPLFRNVFEDLKAFFERAGNNLNE